MDDNDNDEQARIQWIISATYGWSMMITGMNELSYSNNNKRFIGWLTLAKYDW